MAHPQSCHDPENCSLRYVEHLKDIRVSAAAMPTRAPETHQSLVREGRWQRDHEAYRRLAKNGVEPRKIDGSRFIELHAENEDQVTKSHVKIDYSDPIGRKKS